MNTKTNRLGIALWTTGALSLMLLAPQTRAQDEDLPPPPDEFSEPAEPSSDDDVPTPPDEPEEAPEADDTDERPDEPVDSEEATEPSQEDAHESAAQQTLESDETIYVVEEKAYTIGGKFEITPQLVLSFNDRFTNHYGGMITGMYHLRENVGVELAAGYLVGVASEITNEIREKGRLAPEPVDLYALTWIATTNVQWSPIYGKVSVLDLVLGHYSLYFSVGTGVTGLQLERYFDQPGTQYELPMPVAFTSTIGGGLRIYFLDWLGARIEIRDYVQANAVAKDVDSDKDEDFPQGPYFDVQNYYMIQIGTSFIF